MQYESTAYKKYKEYEKHANKHPVKFIEKITGIKLKWYQKINYFISYKLNLWKESRKEKLTK